MTNHLLNLRPGQVPHTTYKKAILAVGATEGHGPHLPTGTDLFIAQGITEDIAACFDDMLVLPALSYGVSDNHMMFDFTLSLSPETLIAVLQDILESLFIRGIFRVILINGHNGNTAPIEIAGRRAHQRHPELKVVSMPAWWTCAERLLPAGTLSDDSGWHAGEMETAAALGYFPDLVDMSLAQDCPPRLPYSPLLDVKYTIAEMSRMGNVGRSSRASREKGLAIREALKQEAVRFIRRLDEMDWDYAVTQSPQ